MKRILLLVILTLIPTVAASAGDVLKVKPGQLYITVFTNQTNLAGCSFTVKRTAPKNEELRKSQREILTTNEAVFIDLYLDDGTTRPFAPKKGVRNEYISGNPERSLKHPIKFGEPFRFESAPTNATSFVIFAVDGKALAGTYTFTAIAKGGKKIAERTIEILPEYGEVTSVLLQLSDATEAFQNATDEIGKRVGKAAEVLKDATPKK
jgi:hypothetical protein